MMKQCKMNLILFISNEFILFVSHTLLIDKANMILCVATFHQDRMQRFVSKQQVIQPSLSTVTQSWIVSFIFILSRILIVNLLRSHKIHHKTNCLRSYSQEHTHLLYIM
jgi:hypothetical protein